MGIQTRYAAISYLDRYLSKKRVYQKNLRRLGMTCLRFASSLFDTPSTSVEDVAQFCSMRNNAILKMESNLLKTLNGGLDNPRIDCFVWAMFDILQCDDENTPLECMIWYLTELSMIDYACVKFLPKKIVGAATLLAHKTFNSSENPWTPNLQRSTGYAPWELKDCVQRLQELQIGNELASYKTVTTKYSKPEL